MLAFAKRKTSAAEALWAAVTAIASERVSRIPRSAMPKALDLPRPRSESKTATSGTSLSKSAVAQRRHALDQRSRPPRRSPVAWPGDQAAAPFDGGQESAEEAMTHRVVTIWMHRQSSPPFKGWHTWRWEPQDERAATPYETVTLANQVWVQSSV